MSETTKMKSNINSESQYIRLDYKTRKLFSTSNSDNCILYRNMFLRSHSLGLWENAHWVL